jgi:hypothetical protein
MEVQVVTTQRKKSSTARAPELGGVRFIVISDVATRNSPENFKFSGISPPADSNF